MTLRLCCPATWRAHFLAEIIYFWQKKKITTQWMYLPLQDSTWSFLFYFIGVWINKAKHSTGTKGQGHIFTFKALNKRNKKMPQHTQVLAHTSRNFTWVQETYTPAFIIHGNWFLRLISNTQDIHPQIINK